MENKLHLNPPSQTPPVGCPLLIKLPSGELMQVERREWVLSHSDSLAFYLPDDGLIVGRYPWTYP